MTAPPANHQQVMADEERVIGYAEQVMAHEEQLMHDEEEVTTDQDQVMADKEQVMVDEEQVMADALPHATPFILYRPTALCIGIGTIRQIRPISDPNSPWQPALFGSYTVNLGSEDA